MEQIPTWPAKDEAGEMGERLDPDDDQCHGPRARARVLILWSSDWLTRIAEAIETTILNGRIGVMLPMMAAAAGRGSRRP